MLSFANVQVSFDAAALYFICKIPWLGNYLINIVTE